MRFTLLAAPGSDPGDARARAAALVAVDGPDSVAAAARASAEPYLLLLGPGARPRPGAFAGVASALGERVGVLGGAAHAGGLRRYGWMLAPATGPLPFEPAPVVAATGEAGADAALRGPIDVVAPGMLLVARELLLQPLPADPLAALIELCARARDARREVVCRPAFACDAPPLDADDRGRAAALRALAERRPELAGAHRLPVGVRRTSVEREVRLEGGRRVRARIPVPKLTAIVHGAGAQLAARRARELAPYVVAARAASDPLAALRAEMRVRGDRYVLIADAAQFPDAPQLDALVEALESAPYVAVAAPSADALGGGCLLLALARFPQHVEPVGDSLAQACAGLVEAARALRRAVRAPGAMLRETPPAPPRRATVVFLAASQPEIMRITLDALVPSTRGDDDLVAVCAAGAHTLQRILAAYPQMRIERDEADPLLTGAANRALGAAQRELVVLVADDVLLSAGALERMRRAFERIPALGAAFPAVAGAPGGEGITDVNYADLAQLRVVAERRAAELARRAEPVDVAVTPVLAVAREALDAVGGIDPAHGPTRRGIADLVARLRAAGYGVVRCDDALAHRFDPAVSRNPAAAASAQQTLAPLDTLALARGFDPAKRVPFESAAVVAAPGAAEPVSHAIALAVADSAELERAAVFVDAAARAFDATAAVCVHLLLDGALDTAEAVARVRPVLAAGGRPMDQTVAVRVERVADLAAWRAALDPGARLVVAAGHEREALAGVPSVAPGGLRHLLEPAVR